ncbi:MAG: urea transporter, partial [Bacteroidota bacterium]
AFFEMNTFFFVLLPIVALLTLLLTLGFQGLFNKYHLPYLSFPFLFAFWIILLSTKYFTQLHPMISNNIIGYKDFINGFNNLALPEIIITFLRSLGSVFFQSNVLVGLMIAVGLLFYSRISFTLAIIGFGCAYVFFSIAGINTRDLNELFVGSNYIFMAIAIGSFFVIPSTFSYVIVVLLVPMVALLHYGMGDILLPFHLPAYTIAFTITTLLFLYLLKWRFAVNYLHPVVVQYSSPEKNLYHFLASSKNYQYSKYYPISLPFWSEWMVSQAHDGKITHLGDWSKAFDFIVLDDELKSYQNLGVSVDDFYCYNKPVLAPGDGYVATIADNIEDNIITDVNTKENWGNSIVINHGLGLYSQLSHLKKESFKVKVGDYVKRGDLIASCGNSGRSPEPHLHFQMQLTPQIGEKTYNYPIGSYIIRKEKNYELKTFDIPKEGELICNPEINILLKNSFNLIPGSKLNWEWHGKKESWEVFTDAWNQLYIYCKENKTCAWFVNDGVVFRFTDFEGDKKSFLYHFYLGCYKVFLGYYLNLSVEENYALTFKNNLVVEYMQDLTAPFFQAVKADYHLKYMDADSINYTAKMELESTSRSKVGAMVLKEIQCKISLDSNGFKEISIKEGNKTTTAKATWLKEL